jgi:hypothetical protein
MAIVTSAHRGLTEIAFIMEEILMGLYEGETVKSVWKVTAAFYFQLLAVDGSGPSGQTKKLVAGNQLGATDNKADTNFQLFRSSASADWQHIYGYVPTECKSCITRVS